ncbi:MAG: pantetheine-phosphate adenylyltransferase [Bdellovibrionales bacterium]
MKNAVYPGSFDPLTNGHLDIIERASNYFDSLVVLVAQSENKKYLFSSEERVSMAKSCLKKLKNVKVDSWDGLTVEYMKKNKISLILRGLRSTSDFDQEWMIAQTNKTLNSQIETMFMCSRPENNFIASRIVKEVALNKGKLDALVPPLIVKKLREKLGAS